MSDPFPELSPSDLFADVRRVGVIRREGRQRERVRRDVVNTIGEYEASYPPFLWQPPPVLATLDPTSGDLGAATTLTVTGTGFVLSSVVYAGEQALPTTYVSDTELTAVATPATPGDVAITVRNGPRASNAATFTVGDLIVTALDPPSAPFNTPAVAITVTGTGFVASSVVYAGDEALPTVYVSGTTLTTSYTTPTTPGPVAFTVHTGSYVSNSVSFDVEDVFTPDKVAGLVAWFDASDAATFVYSSGTEVSEWLNKKVGGPSFIQPTISKQPSRNGVQNGLDCLNYSTGTIDDLFVALNVTAPFTLFLSSYSDGPYHNSWYSVPGQGELVCDSTTLYHGGNIGATSPGGVEEYNRHTIWTIKDPSSQNPDCKVYRNGTLIHGATNAYALNELHTSITQRIAAEPWYAFQRRQFAVIVYAGAISDADQQAVEQMLWELWGRP